MCAAQTKKRNTIDLLDRKLRRIMVGRTFVFFKEVCKCH